jgi:hypothetical protein
MTSTDKELNYGSSFMENVKIINEGHAKTIFFVFSFRQMVAHLAEALFDS